MTSLSEGDVHLPGSGRLHHPIHDVAIPLYCPYSTAGTWCPGLDEAKLARTVCMKATTTSDLPQVTASTLLAHKDVRAATLGLSSEAGASMMLGTSSALSSRSLHAV